MLYLIHFEPAFKHARHYLGFTEAPEARFKAHLAGRGSPLVKAALDAGHEVKLVRVWEGDRNEERRLKNCGGHGVALCPICRPAYLEARRERQASRPWTSIAQSVTLEVS